MSLEILACFANSLFDAVSKRASYVTMLYSRPCFASLALLYAKCIRCSVGCNSSLSEPRLSGLLASFSRDISTSLSGTTISLRGITSLPLSSVINSSSGLASSISNSSIYRFRSSAAYLRLLGSTYLLNMMSTTISGSLCLYFFLFFSASLSRLLCLHFFSESLILAMDPRMSMDKWTSM